MIDKTQERIWKNHRRKTGELDFMKKVWVKLFGDVDEFGKCEECGRWIKFDPFHIAHINSKGARPDLRTTEDNVLILCSDHHTQMDSKFEGKTRNDLKILPKINSIILKYKNGSCQK